MKKYLFIFIAIIMVFSFAARSALFIYAYDENANDSGNNQIYNTSPDQGALPQASETDFRSVYESMKSKYSSLLLEASGNDIACFWDMITMRALGLDSNVDVDFYLLDYDEMSSQVLGKVLVTMVNNNFDVNAKVYNSDCSVIDLLNSYIYNGEFTQSGVSGITMATEQVWVMLGYVLSNSYLNEYTWDYLLSQQNPDGGFGYGSWSDISTSLWVKTLIMLADKQDELSDCIDAIDGYIADNVAVSKITFDTNSLASIVSYCVFDSTRCDELLGYIIESCYHTDGYFTWGGYDGENSFATQAGAQMIGEYFNGSVYRDLMNSYSPGSNDSEDEQEETKVVYVTNNTTNNNDNDNSVNETNNRSTRNQTINNYYQQADPVVVTNTITKEIVKEIEIPATEITLNSDPITNVTPTITLNIPNYRLEIRIFLGILALIAISYSFGTFFNIMGGTKNEK